MEEDWYEFCTGKSLEEEDIFQRMAEAADEILKSPPVIQVGEVAAYTFGALTHLDGSFEVEVSESVPLTTKGADGKEHDVMLLKIGEKFYIHPERLREITRDELTKIPRWNTPKLAGVEVETQPCRCPMLVGGGIDHAPGCSRL